MLRGCEKVYARHTGNGVSLCQKGTCRTAEAESHRVVRAAAGVDAGFNPFSYADGAKRFETGTPAFISIYAAQAALSLLNDAGTDRIHREVKTQRICV